MSTRIAIGEVANRWWFKVGRPTSFRVEAAPLRNATPHVTIWGIASGDVIEPDEARALARLLVEAADRVEAELRPTKTRTVPRIVRFEYQRGRSIALWLDSEDGRVRGWYDGGRKTAEQARDRNEGWECGPCDMFGKEYAELPSYLRALASLRENPTEEVPVLDLYSRESSK